MTINLSTAFAILGILGLLLASAGYIVWSATAEVAAADEAADSGSESPIAFNSEDGNDQLLEGERKVLLDCKCGAQLTLSSVLRGKTVSCPQCRGALKIPMVA